MRDLCNSLLEGLMMMFGKKRNIPDFIKALPCSLLDYQEKTDAKIEADMKDNSSIYKYEREYYYGDSVLVCKRGGIVKLISGYYDRHPDVDQSDKPDIVLPKSDWVIDFRSWPNLNSTGICGRWELADIDPSVVFSDIEIGLPSGSFDCYVVRCIRRRNGGIDRFRFIYCGSGFYCNKVRRRVVCKETYRQFLAELYAITKHWKSCYNVSATDGMHSMIRCTDIGLSTFLSNAVPDNMEEYESFRKKWFHRLF